MSLYLVCQDTDEVGRLLSALSYALDTHQTKPDEEVAYVLLMALGHFLFCNDTGTSKLNTKGFAFFVSHIR